jgi:hypothetical protein
VAGDALLPGSDETDAHECLRWDGNRGRSGGGWRPDPSERRATAYQVLLSDPSGWSDQSADDLGERLGPVGLVVDPGAATDQDTADYGARPEKPRQHKSPPNGGLLNRSPREQQWRGPDTRVSSNRIEQWADQRCVVA